MKKFLLTLVFLCTLCCNSFSQSYFYANNTVEIGVHFGCIDKINGKDAELPIILGSISCYGIYADIGGWSPKHANDYRHYDWDDEDCFAFHVGYQIPVMRYVKITPIIGYYEHRFGWTDGYNKYWDYYGEPHNAFITEYKIERFDCGGQIQLSIPCSDNVNFNLMGTCTTNMFYGGLGVSVFL